MSTKPLNINTIDSGTEAYLRQLHQLKDTELELRQLQPPLTPPAPQAAELELLRKENRVLMKRDQYKMMIDRAVRIKKGLFTQVAATFAVRIRRGGDATFALETKRGLGPTYVDWLKAMERAVLIKDGIIVSNQHIGNTEAWEPGLCNIPRSSQVCEMSASLIKKGMYSFSLTRGKGLSCLPKFPVTTGVYIDQEQIHDRDCK